jgi:hypothetical protein
LAVVRRRGGGDMLILFYEITTSKCISSKQHVLIDVYEYDIKNMNIMLYDKNSLLFCFDKCSTCIEKSIGGSTGPTTNNDVDEGRPLIKSLLPPAKKVLRLVISQ